MNLLIVRIERASLLLLLLCLLGCARTVPVPVPPLAATQTVMAIPLAGIMTQAIVILDGTRIYPPITVLPDGHNTFQLKITAPAGLHSLAITTVDADGMLFGEPLRQVRF